jgi:endosialidase-like protein/type IX secretion system substrate protein
MKKKSFIFCFFNVLIALLFQTLHAQNTSPYWSLTGNRNATTSSKFGTTNNVPLLIFTKNKERLRIDTTGNVGIGMKAPQYRLHVEGGSSPAAIYAHGANGYGVYGKGFHGVYGYSDSAGYGVYGISSRLLKDNGSTGVYGNAYYGVKADGVIGVRTTGISAGVFAVGTGATSYGVYGNSDHIGVYGIGTIDYGIYGTVIDGSGYAGYFAGNVFSSGNYIGSDRTLKKSIADFTKAIDIINKLQPKTYEFRQDGNYKLMHLSQGKHYGFIAQDLEQVLPELVKETKFETRLAQPLTESGTLPVAQEQSEVINFKAVNYTEIIPILVKAVQEQQTQIQAQQTQIEELKNDINTLKQNDAHITTSTGILNQSIPNPTNGIAYISYRLPAGIVHAELIITDMAGKIIKTVPLNGSGSVDINTISLSNGVYYYSLQINSKLIDTKKLIVAH